MKFYVLLRPKKKELFAQWRKKSVINIIFLEFYVNVFMKNQVEILFLKNSECKLFTFRFFRLGKKYSAHFTKSMLFALNTIDL